MKLRTRNVGMIAAAALLSLALVGVASASVTDGRSGRYTLAAATIDAQTGLCFTQYSDTVNGNTFISNPFGDDTQIHVVENKQGAVATCRFTDTSGIYEANAEVGYAGDVCTLVTESGAIYTGGRVTVTAAANNAPDGSDGGNAIIRCQFKN